MGKSETTVAARSPAQVYDEFFVPALFQQWGGVIADMARVAPGQRVLDVACGTGVLACAAAERVGRDGAVTGLDPNDEMLAVARGKSARIEWRNGRAESLPFADASFDRVASQFGLMFFEDKAAGLREMMRVLRPGGRLAVAVCDALDHSPGYAVLAELLQRLFGATVADAFRAPFALGERKQLRSLCEQAGIQRAGCARGRHRALRVDRAARFHRKGLRVDARRPPRRRPVRPAAGRSGGVAATIRHGQWHRGIRNAGAGDHRRQSLKTRVRHRKRNWREESGTPGGGWEPTTMALAQPIAATAPPTHRRRG